MSLKIFLISAIFVVLISAAEECDEKKCIIPKHYIEIGCKPIKEKDQCCPSRFDCDDVLGRPADKCYFQGKTFTEGENIPGELTTPSCSASCFCSKRSDSPPKFTCAFIECPEEVFNRPEAHCIKQKTLDDCCAKDIICDKDEIKKLPTCYMEKREYRMGQIIYPEAEPCYKCNCAEGFDNSTIVGNKNCREISCSIELNRADRIREGCMPVYYGTERCCPITWRCPEVTDELEPATGRSETVEDPKQTCTFGHLTLKVGDGIASINKCIKCECTIPPMAHCVQQPGC